MNPKRLKLPARFIWAPGTRIRDRLRTGTVQGHASFWSRYGRHDTYIVLWDYWHTVDEYPAGSLELTAVKE